MEMLSASCYDETSTSLVLRALRLLGRSRNELPFSALSRALLSEDVEVKTAILRLVQCLVLCSDAMTLTILRADLSLAQFDAHCEAAMEQINAEVSLLFPTTSSTAGTGTGGGLSPPLSPVCLSPRRVVSLARTPSIASTPQDFIAFKGVSSSATGVSAGLRDSDCRLKATVGPLGQLVTALTVAGCFGASVMSNTQWYTLSDDRHALLELNGANPDVGQSRLCVSLVQVTDVRPGCSDAALRSIAKKLSLFCFDVVLSSSSTAEKDSLESFRSFACATPRDRDEWIAAIKAAVDSLMVRRATYFTLTLSLSLQTAMRCVEQFRRLFSEFCACAMEEKSLALSMCELDLDDPQEVFQFLSKELQATGSTERFLSLMRELLLLPSNDAAWECVLSGVKVVRSHARQGIQVDSVSHAQMNLIVILHTALFDESL
jgi:hypothetical protein